MPNGEAYGGQAWIQQAINAAVQAALAQIDWSRLTGYYQPGQAQAGAQAPPTLTEAYHAIYQNRPDLQIQHQEEHEAWSITRYMEHWLGETEELGEGREWTDPASGLSWVNTKNQSAIEFAISHGYVSPGPTPTGAYGIAPGAGQPALDEAVPTYPWQQWAAQYGQGEPTLDRQRYESDEAYRAALLDFDREKQAFQEKYAYDEMALSETLERLRLSQQQQQYMNDYEIAQSQMQLQRDLQLNDLQFQELLRLDALKVRADELDWAREMYYDQSALATRQQDWAELMGQSDLELAARRMDVEEQLADLEERIRGGQLGLDQERMDLERERFTLDDFLARDQAARENKYYELQYVATMSEIDLASARFEFEQVAWRAEHGLAERYFGLEETLGLGALDVSQQQLGLGYLQTLASLQGPQDWVNYWNVQRAAAQTPLPAWAQSLQSGFAFPAFGAGGAVPAGVTGVQPQQVSPLQWFGMSPSEQQGLGGQVMSGGGWMPDWLKSMQAAWPQGQATPISFFGG